MTEPAEEVTHEVSKIARTKTIAAALTEAGFGSFAAIAEATIEDLVKVNGVREKSAATLIEKAKAELAGGDDSVEAVTSGERFKARLRAGFEDLGRIVLYRDPRTGDPMPAIIVDLYDIISGEIGIVCLHAPRPMPGGGRSCATFARATPGNDYDVPAIGEWIWPAKA